MNLRSADSGTGLTLSALVNLEIACATRDDHGREWDRHWAQQRPANELWPERVSAWLTAIAESTLTVGERMTSALSAVSALTVIAGGLLGLIIGTGLFAFSGETPVNIVHVIGVLIVGQWLLLLLLLFRETWMHIPGRALSTRELHLGSLGNLIHLAMGALIQRGHRAEEARATSRLQTTPDIKKGLEAFYQAHGTVIRPLILMMTQRFGVAFNLAVLLYGFYLVTFTDLAFAWASTLEITAADIHQIALAMATPWAWWYPDAVPSADLINATQYYRIVGQYASGAKSEIDPTLVGQWWRFLGLAILFYGFLPRVVLAIFSHFRYRSALRLAPSRSIALHQLRQRLYPAASANSEDSRPTALPHPSKSAGGAIVRWRDLPVSGDEDQRYLQRQYGHEAKLTTSVGGTSNDVDGDQAIDRLLKELKEGDPVFVFVEGWEAPGLAIRSFLTRLRSALGQTHPLFVVLVELDSEGLREVASDRRDLWQRNLRQLKDPMTGLADES